ncbi:hypothetical protein CFC21_066646 [Triticum aestivum]|uniref:Uncharacterized protein n=3 Tax=Triticum TaxID=4564 RepID=A0A9R0TT28_TRITD|nr:hypothetical protein CFC21_066646 [Triticum aestivum]VAI19543.1 unnamed protein product [Triticum turgidum subsp. durum]
MLAVVAHAGCFTFSDLGNQHCRSPSLNTEVMTKEEEALSRLDELLTKAHMYSEFLLEKMDHQLQIMLAVIQMKNREEHVEDLNKGHGIKRKAKPKHYSDAVGINFVSSLALLETNPATTCERSTFHMSGTTHITGDVVSVWNRT